MNLLKRITLGYFGNHDIKLLAPAQLLFLPIEEVNRMSNGCGAKDGIDFVPDNMWGLDISDCCKIHDVMYDWGENDYDKLIADVLLLVNCLRLINRYTKFGGLKMLRSYRAATYFLAVHYKGHKAFYKHKDGDDCCEK